MRSQSAKPITYGFNTLQTTPVPFSLPRLAKKKIPEVGAIVCKIALQLSQRLGYIEKS